MSCPICDAATVTQWRPFCSRRCTDLDLAKWLRGSYAIASQDPEDIEQAQQEISEARDKPH